MDVENEIILMKVQPLREWNSSILSPLVIYITVDRIFTGSKIFPRYFSFGAEGLKTYWCGEWKVGRAKAAHQGLELVSKIPEGEVCNYLGIMDTLGGPG